MGSRAFSLALAGPGIMLVGMLRCARVLALVGLVTACGGESFTVAPEGAGTGTGTSTSTSVGQCDNRGDCALVGATCCDACSQDPTFNQLVAMNENQVSAYRDQVCANDVGWCSECPDTMDPPGFNANCVAGRCVVQVAGATGGN